MNQHQGQPAGMSLLDPLGCQAAREDQQPIGIVQAEGPQASILWARYARQRDQNLVAVLARLLLVRFVARLRAATRGT